VPPSLNQLPLCRPKVAAEQATSIPQSRNPSIPNAACTSMAISRIRTLSITQDTNDHIDISGGFIRGTKAFGRKQSPFQFLMREA